jgi:hypothetical protein
MFRLKNIPYVRTLKAPRHIGHLANDVVYAHLAPSALEELQKRNPQTESGQRATKHHNGSRGYWSSETLAAPLGVTTLMRRQLGVIRFGGQLGYGISSGVDH